MKANDFSLFLSRRNQSIGPILSPFPNTLTHTHLKCSHGDTRGHGDARLPRNPGELRDPAGSANPRRNRKHINSGSQNSQTAEDQRSCFNPVDDPPLGRRRRRRLKEVGGGCWDELIENQQDFD